MWQFWLIVAGIFLVGEIITAGFLIFWLGIGALLAMVLSFFIDSLVIQTAVFVISSIILIFITRPFVNKFVKTEKTAPTNVYSVIGQTGIVTEDINVINATGQVKVNGETWSATCNGNTTISKGTTIKVLEVNGVKLVVEPIYEYTSN